MLYWLVNFWLCMVVIVRIWIGCFGEESSDECSDVFVGVLLGFFCFYVGYVGVL